ncbi:MAG: bifunctional 4-hydroxy-2-oxoglutarate aldolase/2-dehydro-3-deoxy-phosphogluconate aldolase [Nitrososphaerota archaeon]|nr:bifunctional 4-hydroxy-2-oxoglutarate aldolase/2-dehydro-3-deoxy-phosphogluconate aldolase [Nitrososphaerota archaeon]
MGLHEKHEVISKVIEIGLVPIFYHGDIEVAKNVCVAVVKAGSKLLEFTNRGPRAFLVFSELAKWRDAEAPDLILGAGTVLDPATAALYINLGADFIVGPSFNPEVARICNRRHVPYVPGCSTLTEIAYAEELGADIFKIFPAEVLTSKFIKNLLGPCPWLKLMPSGGLEPKKEIVEEWIKAGAVALNMGTSLLRPDLIKAGDYDTLRKKVEECLQYIREAKAKK